MLAYSDLKKDQLLREYESDLSILIAWVEDTLQPSIDLMKLKVSIRELIQDIEDHELKKGVTEKTTASKAKFEIMLDTCERLDKVANQNNSFQLAVKHAYGKISVANKRIIELETELKAIKEAWETE